MSPPHTSQRYQDSHKHEQSDSLMKPSTGRMKVALALVYFLFAILLNSVGTVILQVILTFGVEKGHASVLEGFKDITIAVASFLIAPYLLENK